MKKRQGTTTILYINMCKHHYLNLDIYMDLDTHINIYIYMYTYSALVSFGSARQPRDEKRQGEPKPIHRYW